MTRPNLGVRSLLAHPAVYRLFIRLIGGEHARRVFVTEYLRPNNVCRLLDIGCGTGDLLAALPPVEYVGFDRDGAYVSAARDRFGNRGTFLRRDVTESLGLPPASFDLAVAFGVLHHLDDAGALQLFETARTLLRKEGRLVTFDGCFKEGQSRLARWIISRDRGRAIRTPEALRDLAARVFSRVSICVRHDLLRIPYTHLILECGS